MKRFPLIALILALTTINAASFGIVNFNTCVLESEYGKKEQESFEKLRSQMTTLVQDIETKLKTVSEKLNDPDHRDSLSPEAEKQLYVEFQSLNEELNRYQNQFMQVMQQANMQIMQSMADKVAKASEVVAKERKLPLVLNKEMVFYYDEKDDVTDLVVKEMDKRFARENKDNS